MAVANVAKENAADRSHYESTGKDSERSSQRSNLVLGREEEVGECGLKWLGTIPPKMLVTSTVVAYIYGHNLRQGTERVHPT